jgi:predicted DNA-binding antitoxin AbrB/MazE fold protein
MISDCGLNRKKAATGQAQIGFECMSLTGRRWTMAPIYGYALDMTIRTNAVFESGVLRPLTPLDLQEHQVVSLAISTSSEPTDSVQEVTRDHTAFLNSYAPEDEGLYDDYSAG